MNLMVARSLNPELYGQVFVNLYTLYSSLLFICREPFRRTSMRLSRSGKNLQGVSSLLSFVTLPLCVILAAIVSPYYEGPLRSALPLYVLAVLLELTAEPIYLTMLSHQDIPSRVYAEGYAVLSKCFLTAFLVLFMKFELMAFAYAQLAYSSLIFLQYVYIYPLNLPVLSQVMQMDSDTWTLLFAFEAQTLIKLILTEGEKMVLIYLHMPDEYAGVYGLVHNLGSLVVRLFFQPLEEIAAIDISKSLESNPSQGQKDKVFHLLTTISTCIGSVALTGAFLGPHFASLVIHVLYGRLWGSSNAPVVLSWYCLYLLLLAYNGVLEAFLFSAIDGTQMLRYNVIMTVFSVIYISSSFIFLNYLSIGPHGLVWANCINLFCRIVYALRFAHLYFKKSFWNIITLILPNIKAIFVMSLCSLVCFITKSLHPVVHLFIGILCVPIIAVTIWYVEPRVRTVFGRRKS